jgi:hypothetical protein
MYEYKDDEPWTVDKYPQLGCWAEVQNNGRMSVEAAIASYVQMYAYKDDEPWMVDEYPQHKNNSTAPKGFVLYIVLPPEIEIIKPNRL